MLTRVRVVALGDCLESSAFICQFEKKNQSVRKGLEHVKGFHLQLYVQRC
jgi:hypothetical protein